MGKVILVLSCIVMAAALIRVSIAPDPVPTNGATLLGVEMGPVRVSAAGYMLDVRYRVVDPVKARPLFERRQKPVLLDPDSGLKVGVASFDQTGPLRNSNTPQVGRRYVMMFQNPAGVVKAGDEVSLIVGDVEISNLLVQ